MDLTQLAQTSIRCLPMTGIVLIGGRSRRFGTDRWPGWGKLIERVTDIIAPLFSEIILIGHVRRLEGFHIVEDLPRDRGHGRHPHRAERVETPHASFRSRPFNRRAFIEYMIWLRTTTMRSSDLVEGREPLTRSTTAGFSPRSKNSAGGCSGYSTSSPP